VRQAKAEIPKVFGFIAVLWVLIVLSVMGLIGWAAIHFISKYW